MNGPENPATGLEDAARDRLYAACAEAITAAGDAREALFLGRLVLLLFEAVGDEARCRNAIETALGALPFPTLSATVPGAPTESPSQAVRRNVAADDERMNS